MALGLSNSSSGGEYLPIVKWDARAGRLFRVDRTQGPNGWESQQVDLTNGRPSFLIDFGGIEVGYMAFTATGPDFKMVPLGQQLPAKPSADHKQGARVRLFSPKNFGGVREFSSNAKAVLGAIDTLHSAFEASPEAAQGKVPVVQLDGSTAIVTKGPSGNVTSYAPTFTVVSWADRPTEFGERTVPAPGHKAAAPAPTPAPAAHVPAPSNHVPPPHVTASVPENATPAGMPEW